MEWIWNSEGASICFSEISSFRVGVEVEVAEQGVDCWVFFMSVVGVDRLDLIEWDVHDFLKTRKSSSGRGMVRW